MFREILASRAILIGIVFFVVVVGSSLLYSWHVRRTIATELVQTDPAMPQLENEKPTAEDLGVSIDTDRVGEMEMYLETGDTQTMSEETEALPHNNVSNNPDAAAPEKLSLFQTEIEDIIDSDFPDVPTDFPENLTPIWIEFPNYQKGDMRDHEMIYRVLIKLWNQGDSSFVNGIFRDNNQKVYPLYPDVLYVRWDEESIGSPENPRTILVPKSMIGAQLPSFTPEEMLSGRIEELYPDIRFVDIETTGYDPETFLTNGEK